MVKDILIKRLLTQGGVSVLAGLLMSSAVLAGDMSEPASEPEVAAEAVRDTKDAIEAHFGLEAEQVEPEVHIDPMPEPPPEGVEFDPESFELTAEKVQPEWHIDPMPEPSPEGVEFDGAIPESFELTAEKVEPEWHIDPMPGPYPEGVEFDGAIAESGGAETPQGEQVERGLNVDSMPEAAQNTFEFDGMAAEGGDVSRSADGDKDPSAGSSGDLGTYQRTIVK